MTRPRPTRSAQRAVLLALAVLSALLVALVTGATAAAAAGERAGDAVVVDEADAVLVEGGSATVFGLRLPDGASCPGDSSDDNYRIEGFLVPDGTDPGTLVYGEMAPEGEGNWGLWDTNTESFDGGLTSDADPGQPGLIVDVPNFSFGVLYPDELAAGDYRIGVACSLFDETTRYWDASFVVVADSSDEPARFRWTATPAEGAATDGSSDVGLTLLLGGAVVIAAVIGAGFFLLRPRSPRTTPSKERSS